MLAQLLVLAAIVYAAIGLAVMLAFVFYGVDRIDPSARGAYAFRPLILPGGILLWPLVLRIWRRRMAAATGTH